MELLPIDRTCKQLHGVVMIHIKVYSIVKVNKYSSNIKADEDSTHILLFFKVLFSVLKSELV